MWDAVAGPGVDAVWLMGVWSRSPAGAEIARHHPAMAAAQAAALPDVTDADVIGSAYCIRDYTVDAALGGEAVWRRHAPNSRPAASVSCSTSSPTTSPPTIRGRASTPSTSCGVTPTTWPATRQLPRGRRRRDRPWTRSVLPGVARGAPARHVGGRHTGGGRRGGVGDRGALRRRAVRHGDADARRRVPPHVGRPGDRWRPARRRGAATGRR